jgi:hypothetical protein
MWMRVVVRPRSLGVGGIVPVTVLETVLVAVAGNAATTRWDRVEVDPGLADGIGRRSLVDGVLLLAPGPHLNRSGRG